jgi:two-component system NtrC family sensor kinase
MPRAVAVVFGPGARFAPGDVAVGLTSPPCNHIVSWVHDDLHRTMSIQSKLLLTLAGGLALVILLGLLYYVNLVTIRRRLTLVESMDDLEAAVGEMRRAEKNYLLYGDRANADALLAQVAHTRYAIEEKAPELVELEGAVYSDELQHEASQYADLAQSLVTGESSPDGVERLRERGQELDRYAHGIVHAERERIERMIVASHRTLLLSLLATLGLGALAVFMVSRLVVGPLRRIERATREVSEGRFVPIEGIGSQDEIGRLAIAFNHMVGRIERHQDDLLRAGKLASLGTLTSGVAHELNNPLNNISMIAQTFVEHYRTLNDEERLEYMSEVDRQCERSREIVHNLLDFSRVKGSERILGDVSDLARRSLKLVRNQLELADIAAVVQAPDDLPPVRMNPHQIEQVLVNVYTNAIKAMPQGGTLSVECGLANEGESVTVTVRDTGVGIPPEILPRIFDPFFTTSDVGGGTGLGLSVSYGIVKRHGGSIDAESRPGSGTAFTISLPRDRGGEGDEREAQDPGRGR